MTVRKVCSPVKTGKAVWWVSLIGVWLQPSWLPALLASLASAGWLLCPHLTLLTHKQLHMWTLYPSTTNTLVGTGQIPGLSPLPPLSHTWDTLLHHQRQGNGFLPSQLTGFYTSCLSFPSDFFLKSSFHHKPIYKVLNRSVPVCLSWIDA